MPTLTMKHALEQAGADRMHIQPRKIMTASEIQKTYGRPHKSVQRHKNPDDIFIVKNGKGLSALKYWLRNRKSNTFVETLDKNGNPLFGLLWDYELGRFPSTKRKKRGAVVILDKALQKPAALIILSGMATETEYGKQWAQAQRDLWTHGRT